MSPRKPKTTHSSTAARPHRDATLDRPAGQPPVGSTTKRNSKRRLNRTIPVDQAAATDLVMQLMAVHGIPTVTLGYGQQNPHMTTESLDLRNYWVACQLAWRLATPDRK